MQTIVTFHKSFKYYLSEIQVAKQHNNWLLKAITYLAEEE